MFFAIKKINIHSQKINKVFKNITSKPLWVNVVAACGIVAALIFLFFIMLSWVTRHNQTEKVPTVVGQHIKVATKTLEDNGFNVIVSDSVYDASVPPLMVTRQLPDADALVKKGRTIYLSINRASAPMATMPNLIGYSFRSAGLYLQSAQLKLGEVTYKPDIARNAVLEQLYNGQAIQPGTPIPIGSTISFVLGSGTGNSEMSVPDLTGLTFAQAKEQLASLNLGVGAVVVLGSIKDTANAFVVKQNPTQFITDEEGNNTLRNKVRSGQLIDIYISNTTQIIDSLK
jgi:beta-lactam-binding protein with PASTA domain